MFTVQTIPEWFICYADTNTTAKGGPTENKAHGINHLKPTRLTA